MKIDEILEYALKTLEGTVLAESYGEAGIYYNPNNVLKRGVYILTIKEKDGKNDKSSNLNRDDTFRINLGIRKESFNKLFGGLPKRPTAGQVVDMDFDFTQKDIIMPHPVYAWMGWISVVNPSKETFELLKPLIDESYQYAVEKFNKKKLV